MGECPWGCTGRTRQKQMCCSRRVIPALFLETPFSRAPQCSGNIRGSWPVSFDAEVSTLVSAVEAAFQPGFLEGK